MKKYISFIFCGFFLSRTLPCIFGPALLDLAAQAVDIQSIGSIFLFRAVGYLTGAVLYPV